MHPEELEAGKKYKTTSTVDACLYMGEDCEVTDVPGVLLSGTELTYVGPDNDPNGGYVFEAAGNKYCLHDNDMTSVEEA